MCGIFGGLLREEMVSTTDVRILAKCAEERGRDSSGLILYEGKQCRVVRGDLPVTDLVDELDVAAASVFAGHSRLATNGTTDNQPVVRDGIITIHNGIICNLDQLWKNRAATREFTIDSEIIPVIVKEERLKGSSPEEIASALFSQCEGVISAAVFIPAEGVLLLFSNNGSLYCGKKGDNLFFSSESWSLRKMGCEELSQVKRVVELKTQRCESGIEQTESASKFRPNLLPDVVKDIAEERLLETAEPNLKRCSRCVLPETMPFISFDKQDVCNYCHHYTKRNQPKPVRVLEDLVEPYRRSGEADCIVPFSGGRDSCYGLHLIVKELGMNPIAYRRCCDNPCN